MSANRPRRAPARRRPTAGPAKQRPARAQRPAREPESPPETLFLATIPGATPSKWVDRFTSRARTVQLLNHDQSAQAAHLAHDPDGAARFALPPLGYLRWPGDGEPADVLRAAGVAPEHVHVVRLYQEAAVVCVGTDHLLAAWDADADGPVPLTELDPAEAYSPVDFAPPAPQDPLEVPEVPGSGERTVLEIVATGAGHAVLPMSVARMFGRKDVVVLPVQTSVGMEDDDAAATDDTAAPADAAASPDDATAATEPDAEPDAGALHPGWWVGLAWLRSQDSELVQQFVGVSRGRRASSSR